VKLAFKPAGRLPPLLAERDSATGALNPPTSAVMFTITAPSAPCGTLRVFGAIRLKPGCAWMVTGRVRTFVMPPPTALTVRLYVPAYAVEPAVMVRVLVPSPGAAIDARENDAVTWAGRPETDSATVALNVPTCAVVMAT